LHDRLLPREALYIEAWAASIGGSPRTAFEKWKMLVSLYPDFFSGEALYAYFAWILGNNYDADIVAAAQRAAAPQNPNARSDYLLLGALMLGNDRYADAVRYYGAAEAGGFARTAEFATVYAAQRQFQKAEEVTSRSKLSGNSAEDIGAHTAEITIAVDRGDWELAWKVLALANKEATGVNIQRQLEFRETELSLRALTGTLHGRGELHEYINSALSALSKADAFDRPELQNYLLIAAYLAANQGEPKLAADVLVALGSEPRSGEYPILTKLQRIAQAEIARASGDAAAAIHLLELNLDGSEPCLTHLALLDARAAHGDKAAALDSARWLVAHRGRAYAEYGLKSIIPFDVAQTDLALLRIAELDAELGKKETSQQALATFRKAWPDSEQNPAIAVRVKAVTTE